jgi:hypothetical protein
MQIHASSGAIRFHVKDGWCWDDILHIASQGSRIIYFKDDYPYWVCDSVNFDRLKPFVSSVRYSFKEDEKLQLRELVESRNI